MPGPPTRPGSRAGGRGGRCASRCRCRAAPTGTAPSCTGLPAECPHVLSPPASTPTAPPRCRGALPVPPPRSSGGGPVRWDRPVRSVRCPQGVDTDRLVVDGRNRVDQGERSSLPGEPVPSCGVHHPGFGRDSVSLPANRVVLCCESFLWGRSRLCYPMLDRSRCQGHAALTAARTGAAWPGPGRLMTSCLPASSARTQRAGCRQAACIAAGC
jgi:hypothetical protein